MYCSLDRIDLLASDQDGGNPHAVQTDHRSAEEIEAEPEISTLFAIARVLVARQYLVKEGKGDQVVYAAIQAVPPRLAEALAATGARYTLAHDLTKRTPPPTTATTEELVDHAFAGLARRVARRTGLTDPAAVLRALEAEPAPARTDDEIAYWTRVLELMAATAQVVRTRTAARWTTTDQSDVPFALALDGNRFMLPGNRAQRFLGDGASESMFFLLTALDEAKPEGPIMPNLRPRDEAKASRMIWRPLLADLDDPVIVYGNDGENTIGWLTTTGTHDLERVHADALRNIAAHEVEVEPLDVDGANVVVVTGSFFATEKLLDAAFMRSLGRRLGSEILVAAVPRRGVMFVAPMADTPVVHALAAREYEQGGSRKITPLVLVIANGELSGHVRV